MSEEAPDTTTAPEDDAHDGEPEEGTGRRQTRNHNLTRNVVEYLIEHKGTRQLLADVAAAVGAPTDNVAAAVSYMRAKGMPIDRPAPGTYVYQGDGSEVDEILVGRWTIESIKRARVVKKEREDERRAERAKNGSTVLSILAANRTPPPVSTITTMPRPQPLRGQRIAVETGELFEAIGSTVDGYPLVSNQVGVIFKLVPVQ